jgi:hypothetical protein
MYKVKSQETTWQKIQKFEVWKEDENYFIFYWSDGDELIIKKELVLYIRKY